MKVGSARDFKWLEGIVKVTLLLNLCDAILTLIWLESGLAEEANPLMQQLLEAGPVFFVLGKTALVSLGSFILWKRRRRVLSVIGIFVAFLVYYFILLYHLRAMNIGLLQRFG